jgi:thiol:disulfide interchange protein DsbD
VSFATAFAGLFLAGMILNLMPCVFPVLALKILSFAKQAGKDPAQTRRHGLAYTMGLLVFVWLVAGGMFVAKSMFHLELAWGDLTRYSGPMAAVVIVLFLLGLNLAGLFEIGTSLGNVGGSLQDQSGYAGSFWSGALTMLISTPCSGPFMAVAMGYALQQPPLQQFILFTGFGLGIALPYVALASSPPLLKLLPRPGAWMETFKKALAFPMFAAAIYFYNTFGEKTGASGSSLLLWSLLCIAVAAWIYGHWCSPSRSVRSRLIGGFMALLIIAGGTSLALDASHQRLSASGHEAIHRTGDLVWTRWSPETLAAERAKGRAVFVDYTTLGCYTCDVNEANVFKSPKGSDKVIAKFRALNIAPLRAKYLADGTPEDNAIRDSLKPWEISTFPAYIMYPADASKPPFLISDSLLSQSQVMEALEKAVH